MQLADKYDKARRRCASSDTASHAERRRRAFRTGGNGFDNQADLRPVCPIRPFGRQFGTRELEPLARDDVDPPDRETEALLCILPEGALTRDGEIAQFKRGIERIISETPVRVLPMALRGLWGSFFRHRDGVFRPKGRFWSRVHIIAGELVPAAEVTSAKFEALVKSLRGPHP